MIMQYLSRVNYITVPEIRSVGKGMETLAN